MSLFVFFVFEGDICVYNEEEEERERGRYENSNDDLDNLPFLRLCMAPGCVHSKPQCYIGCKYEINNLSNDCLKKLSLSYPLYTGLICKECVDVYNNTRKFRPMIMYETEITI